MDGQRESLERREGPDAETKRATIVVTVPEDERPWHPAEPPAG
jgi:hypothetical protein